jgi:hypothetical protein
MRQLIVVQPGERRIVQTEKAHVIISSALFQSDGITVADVFEISTLPGEKSRLEVRVSGDHHVTIRVLKAK